MTRYRACNMSRRRFLGQVLAGAALVGFGGCDGRNPDVASATSGNAPDIFPGCASYGTATSNETALPLPRTILYTVNDKVIEQWPPVAARSLVEHLGFNLGYAEDLPWVLDRAQAAGCREIRAHPGTWSNEEIPDSPGKYRQLSQSLVKALNSRGMCTRLVGVYGPPWQTIAQLTLLSPADAGDTILHVDGDLSGFTSWQCFLGLSGNGPVPVSEGNKYLDKWSYYGTLVLEVDPSEKRITLAAPVIARLSTGTPLVLNKLMYPFPLQADPKDQAVVAYCNYLRELARQIESNGGTGSVEIWNEPPWPDDSWLTPGRFFSGSPPSWMTSAKHDFAVFPAIFENLSANWPYRKVKLCNSATNKTADGDWLFFKAQDWTVLENPDADLLTPAQAQIFTESFHPYGPFPESFTWYPTAAETFPYEIVQGGSKYANYSLAAAAEERFHKQYGYSLPLEITEAGLNVADDFVQALFMLRLYLAYQSLGVKNVDFYALEEESHYALLDSVTHKERLALTTFNKLIDLVKPVASGQIIIPAIMPQVKSYDGQWPLMMVPILGNGQFLLALYQRNYLETGKSWSDESGASGYAQATGAQVVLDQPENMHYRISHEILSPGEIKTALQNDGTLLISNLRDIPIFLSFSTQG